MKHSILLITAIALGTLYTSPIAATPYTNAHEPICSSSTTCSTTDVEQMKAIAVKKAKAWFVAVANADIRKMKELLTPNFYSRSFPYDDNTIREILLSRPYQKRQEMIDQVMNHTTATTIMNRAGDAITVILDNNVTGKVFTIQLIDESGTGNWKICNYDY
jgi:hypothetical protein